MDANEAGPGSFIYAIRAGVDGPVKLGTTTQDPIRRLAELQTGAHDVLALIWFMFGDRTSERHMHYMFANFRLRGEWFDFGDMESSKISIMLSRARSQRLGSTIVNLPEWLAQWPEFR